MTEREAPVESPGRRRSSQKRDKSADVQIRAERADNQHQNSRVNAETDDADDCKAEKLSRNHALVQLTIFSLGIGRAVAEAS